MNQDVYLSLLSKLSTVTPLFAKALLDISLKNRGLDAATITPVDLLKIIREDLDPKLAESLKSCNSILFAGTAMVISDRQDRIVHLNSVAKHILSVVQAGAGTLARSAFSLLWDRGFVKSVAELRDVDVREFYSSDLGRIYNVSAAPQFDESGEVVGAISVIQDNTLKNGLESAVLSFCDLLQEEIEARRNAEDQLAVQITKSVAVSKMAALGEMAGGIAHEINSPLATISLLAGQLPGLIHQDPLKRDVILRFSEKIEKTVQRISQIVIGLKAFSRESSRDLFQRESVRQIIDNTTALCSEKFKNHGIPIFYDEIPEDLSVECRASQISQVLLNLLNNAYDAVSSLPEKWIRIGAREDGGWVEIFVTDAGPGILPEVRLKVFQPFFTTKDVGKGTGLGLSISMGIVESHHGTLTIDTSVEHTRFVLRLPKRQVSAPAGPFDAAIPA